MGGGLSLTARRLLAGQAGKGREAIRDRHGLQSDHIGRKRNINKGTDKNGTRLSPTIEDRRGQTSAQAEMALLAPRIGTRAGVRGCRQVYRPPWGLHRIGP